MSGWRKITAVVVLLLMASFVAGCASGGDEDASGGDGTAYDMDVEGEALLEEASNEKRFADVEVTYDSVGSGVDEALSPANQSSGGGSSGSGGGGSTGQRAATLPDIGPSVIKTAALGVEIERGSFRNTVQDAIDAAERHGGFVLSTQMGGDDARRGSLVLRVPAEQFESTLGELKGLADKVTREEISGQDVSQEFVDLNARLRNYEAQETVLLDLMSKASTVTASIRVQRELQSIQLEIERLRGRVNFLKDQTSYSTISVSFKEVGVVSPTPKGALAKAWEQAKDTFVDVIAAVIVGAGFVVPIAILAAIAALIGRLVWPRVGRRPGVEPS